MRFAPRIEGFESRAVCRSFSPLAAQLFQNASDTMMRPERDLKPAVQSEKPKTHIARLKCEAISEASRKSSIWKTLQLTPAI